MAQTYSALAADAPPGAAKENVMGRYLNFIETHYDPTGKRNLWFTQVVSMLQRTRRGAFRICEPPLRSRRQGPRAGSRCETD